MAKIRKMYRVTEGEWSGLADDSTCYDTAKPVEIDELNAKEIAEFLDQQAENCNQHSFVGVHRELVKLLKKHADMPIPSLIMRDVLRAGGLHEMG